MSKNVDRIAELDFWIDLNCEKYGDSIKSVSKLSVSLTYIVEFVAEIEKQPLAKKSYCML
ncbi:hypothetical protein [Oceanobacillus kapialis]|uniref:hypothetical protein n=1 Tax=Oceanobacillus kapialis TaxID=481353 RepID=UPI00384F3292